MENDKSLIRYVIGASRIKYEVLDKLFGQVKTSGYRLGVLMVDAHCVFGRLYREKNLANLYASNVEEFIRDLVVGFFNVLGHYRRYMATRLHFDNDIYVMFNRRQPKYNSALIAEFGEKIASRYDTSSQSTGFLADMIGKAYEFIVGISPYFEGIYCIENRGIDDYAVMSEIGFQEDIFYTIFSKSAYGLQLLRSNVVMLTNRRDDSLIITADGCYNEGILRERRQRADKGLRPEMLPMLWCLAGCSDVSVPRTEFIGGISKMIGVANRMVKDGVLDTTTGIGSFLESVGDYLKCGPLPIRIERATLERRYRGLSASLAAQAMTSDQMARIAAHCYNMFDENTLEDINETLAAGSIDPELLELTNLNMANAIEY